MSHSRKTRRTHCLGQLKTLLENAAIRLPAERPPAERASIPDAAILENDDLLFCEAMADVVPITASNRICCMRPAASPPHTRTDPDREVIDRLRRLVKYGEGFVVSQTPEYMEGRGLRAHPELTRRLHRGDFSIEAHIDLHGLSVEEARTSLDCFLRDAVRTGKRAVLVVHGRGLSSPGRPVLKNSLYRWLTAGPWRKWVLAFSSARRCDGGAGATYILLRSRPLTSRSRKKKKNLTAP